MLRIQHSHDGHTWHVNEIADRATLTLMGRDNLTGWKGLVDLMRQKITEQHHTLSYRLVEMTGQTTRVIH